MSIENPRNAREANYLALAATPEEIVERVLLLIAQQQQSVNLSSAVVSGTLPVSSGGTSVATLTSHGVLVGEGTSAVIGVTGATGQVLHANTGADPTFSAVSLTADITGVLAETHGGTNQSSYTLGDTLYASAANTISKLSGNITATRKFLRQTGSGAVSAAPTWDTILAADVPGSALTKTDDTNVTLTLGGAPTTALLNAASLTLGWTGQLGLTRGGTAASLTAANGGVVYSTAAALAINTPGSSGNWLQSAGAAAPAWTAPATLSKTDDTNVTLTLGGSPTTALLNAASITAGWTGTLSLARGGTAAGLTASTGGIVYSGAAAFAVLSGTATAGQMLRSGATAAPTWSTATFPATAGTAANVLRSDGTNFLSAALAAADLSNGTTGSGNVVLKTNAVLVTPALGTPSSGTLTSCTGLPVSAGTTPSATNDSASASQLGEHISSSVTAVTINTASAGNVTSISLTAGDWDVAGCVASSNIGTNAYFRMGISQTSATISGTEAKDWVYQSNNTSISVTSASIPQLRVSLSGTTTVYLVAQMGSANNSNISGYISARRVR